MKQTFSIEQAKDFASKLMLIKHEAMELGLYRTGHLLEIPIIEIGWEMQNMPTPETQEQRKQNVLTP